MQTFNVIVAMLAVSGLVSAAWQTTPDEAAYKMKNGLLRICWGWQSNPYLTPEIACSIYQDWYGRQPSKHYCPLAGEKEWMQYCQSLYYEGMAIDCVNVNPTSKREILDRMSRCVD